VKPFLARVLTRLHSRAWRARYGAEFEALLLELAPNPPALFDTAESIVASRRSSAVAFATAIALLLVVGDGRQLRATITVQRTVVHRYVNHAALHEPRPCGAYSSIPREDWMRRKECLV
jgi:hypothetical protein